MLRVQTVILPHVVEWLWSYADSLKLQTDFQKQSSVSKVRCKWISGWLLPTGYQALYGLSGRAVSQHTLVELTQTAVDGESCSSRMLSWESLFWTVRPISRTIKLTLSSVQTKSYFITSRNTKREVLVSQVGTLEDLCTFNRHNQGFASSVQKHFTSSRQKHRSCRTEPPASDYISTIYYIPLICITHFLCRTRSWARAHSSQLSSTIDPVQTFPVSARSLNLAPLWSWAFTSPVSYSKLSGLLSKFEAHFNQIRNSRRKTHHSRRPAQTLSRNVCWKVGNYGNVIAAMSPPGSWTNMHKGWGFQLWIVWAAELEVRETVQHKLTGGTSWKVEGWMIPKSLSRCLMGAGTVGEQMKSTDSLLLLLL